MPIYSLVTNPVKSVDQIPTYTWQMYAFMFLIALCAFFQQGLMALAMKYNTIGAVAVILYLAIPLGFVLDMIFFNKKLSSMEILGACIIVVVNITIAMMRIFGCIKEEDPADEDDKAIK